MAHWRLLMQQISAKVRLDNFAFGTCPFQHLYQNQTGEIIGFSGIIGMFKGALADGRYKLSQRSVDPVIAMVCSHVDNPFLRNVAYPRSFCDPTNR
jgi:hypothetical protein